MRAFDTILRQLLRQGLICGSAAVILAPSSGCECPTGITRTTVRQVLTGTDAQDAAALADVTGNLPKERCEEWCSPNYGVQAVYGCSLYSSTATQWGATSIDAVGDTGSGDTASEDERDAGRGSALGSDGREGRDTGASEDIGGTEEDTSAPINRLDIACDVDEYYSCDGVGRPTDCATVAQHVGTTSSTVACQWFERAAALEAASAYEFARLRSELAALDAPMPLLQACDRATEDEWRHADTMDALAAAYGGRGRTLQLNDVSRRSLWELALENAVVGCVEETWGALVGMYQAETASDPAVRQAMAVVAADEARHAALSFALHHHLWQRLAPTERERLDQAMANALSRLVADGRQYPEAPELGLPIGDAQARLLAAYQREWPRLAAPHTIDVEALI